MFRTIHASVLVAGLLGLAAHGLAQDSPPAPPGKVGDLGKKDLVQRLQGTWRVLSIEELGQKAPEAKTKGMSLVFDGDKLHLFDNGKPTRSPEGDENGELTFTVDANQKPARITLAGKNAPTFPTLGIFAFEGDTLKICCSKFSNELPTDFKSEEKSATVLIQLQRVKTAEK